jgi:hypothetical protein
MKLVATRIDGSQLFARDDGKAVIVNGDKKGVVPSVHSALARGYWTVVVEKGSSTSGNFGHSGRPGSRGGSAPGSRAEITDAVTKSPVELASATERTISNSARAAIETDGDAKSLWNNRLVLGGQTPGMYGTASWDGTMAIDRDGINSISKVLVAYQEKNQASLTVNDLNDARFAISSLLHENVHMMRNDETAGERQSTESQRYQETAGRILEEGTTELYSNNHYNDFVRALGLDKIGRGILLSKDDDKHLPTGFYASPIPVYGKERGTVFMLAEKAAEISGNQPEHPSDVEFNRVSGSRAVLDGLATSSDKAGFLARTMLSGDKGDEIVANYAKTGGILVGAAERGTPEWGAEVKQYFAGNLARTINSAVEAVAAGWGDMKFEGRVTISKAVDDWFAKTKKESLGIYS